MIKCNDRGFVYDDAGKLWLPPINPKQFEVFNDFHRYLLVHGPRKSSKTWGVLHKCLRHAFDLNGAMFAIVCKTIKNAKSSGVWTLLCNVMIPFWEHGIPPERWEDWMPESWRHGCPGFEVVEGPKTTGDTKLSFVRIRNRHGTISEIQCHSLEHSQEVEAKFKGPYYSGFWCSEFDQYLDRHAFDILCDALRMPGIPFDQHQIICDCNPPESGRDNWMHDLWFKLPEEPNTEENKSDQILKDGLHNILIEIQDNPQLDPRERDELKARYRKRKALYARFIEGKWEQDIDDGFFSEVYDEGVHVLGRVDCPPEEREILVPSQTCRVLIAGWDAGLAKNHSFHIEEKIVHESPFEDPHTGEKKMRKRISYSVLDEFVVIDTYMSIKDFALECMKKIIFWTQYVHKQSNVVPKWRHWSDTDAFEIRSAANKCTAAIVYESTDGQVVLDGAPKYRNSQSDRVNLVSELLEQQRLHISAQLTYTRRMFANLKQGKGADFIRRDRHKHPFDSLSYPMAAESPIDMLKSSSPRTDKKPVSFVVAAVR